MRKKNVPIIFCLLALSLFALEAAHGQETTNEDVYEISPMTVISSKKKKSDMALKIEKNVQEIPMSIDVFTASEIKDAKIESIPTLTRFSPNVHMKEMPIFHYPVIRGLSTFHTSVGTNSGLIADDVFYPASYMQNIDLLDIEQAEILKGPQGTLYGRNTQSGLIVIRSRQPGNQFQGKVETEYGSNNSFKAGANLSGPVIDDTLFLGGLLQYRVSDGYYDNIGTGIENPADLEHLNGRGTLRWTPSDPLDIIMTLNYTDIDDHAGALRKISGPLETPAHTVKKDSEEFLKQNTSTQALKIKYKGDRFDFISVSTALNQDLDKLTDNDFTDDATKQKETNLIVDAESYSQEFRVSQNEKGPFEWVAGVSFFDEKVYKGAWKETVSTGAITSSSGTNTNSTGYALFGEETYTLFEKLHLTAGLRLEHMDLDGHFRDLLGNQELKGEKDYDEALPKAAVSYDLTKTAMTYATVSRGYKAGGFNGKLEKEIFTYDAEYLWNYEAGIKTAWFGNMLVANLSVFYMDLTDKQVSEYDEATDESIITNAGDGASKGVELEVRLTPVPGLDLFAGVGYNQAKIDSFSATEKSGTGYVETDYSGKYLPFAPQFTYNVGVQYRSLKGFFARADILGNDKFYGDIANTLEQEAYFTVNMRLGYAFKSFDIHLNVENLFDEEYLTYMKGSADNAIGSDGPSRTISLGVRYRF